MILSPHTTPIEAAVSVVLPLVVSADDEFESTATPQLVAASVTWPIKFREAFAVGSSAITQFGDMMLMAAAVALAPTFRKLPPEPLRK